MLVDLATREEFSLITGLRVRWSEIDAQGIVFNPHYLAYADLAMTEYMRALGLPYAEAVAKYGSDWFAVRAEIDFMGSAVFDDELELAARVEALGRTSFRIRFAIFRAADVLTQIRTTYVNASVGAKKPVPLHEDFIARVVAFERTPPLR